MYEVQATARTPGASTKAGVVKYEHGSLVLWRAALNGVVLGFHRNEEDAAEAYDAAVRADAKEAPLSVNFPDPDRKEATNLRLAQKRMSGASKYAGVTKYKGQSSSAPTRWGASHPIMGALGRFATEEEAARAWDNAERGCGRIVAVNSPRSGAGPPLKRRRISAAKKPAAKPLHLVEWTLPKDAICPITLESIDAPAFGSCGHVFEREAIMDWFSAQRNDGDSSARVSRSGVIGVLCPMCRRTLGPSSGMVKRVATKQKLMKPPDL